jgi:hypothetical protein
LNVFGRTFARLGGPVMALALVGWQL